MTSSSASNFKLNYQTHLKHLKLKGLQPKTIDAYSRAIRRIGEYFDHQINELSEPQLTDYFTDLLESHSWSAVKLDLDLYGLKFFFRVSPFPLGAPFPSAFFSPFHFLLSGYSCISTFCLLNLFPLNVFQRYIRNRPFSDVERRVPIRYLLGASSDIALYYPSHQKE
jgi:Phage integrase, N-terminal SAM-like domain